jgi:MFS family permease
MMGWHGSAMTAGSAIGAPIAGFAIDHGGWQWGFVVVSALGVLIAVAGLLVSRRRSGRRDDGVDAGTEVGANAGAQVVADVGAEPGPPAGTAQGATHGAIHGATHGEIHGATHGAAHGAADSEHARPAATIEH